MKRTGGFIALCSGLCGALAALITLIVAGAFAKSGRIPLVAILEWRGVIFSAMVVTLAAICMASRSRRPAVFLTLTSLAATVLSGAFVSFWMALASLGGLIALAGSASEPDALAARVVDAEGSCETPR